MKEGGESISNPVPKYYYFIFDVEEKVPIAVIKNRVKHILKF